MKLVCKALSIGLLGMATSVNAAVEVINFEDRTAGTNSAIENGYAGFNWQNGAADVYVIEHGHHPGSGYDAGVISGVNVAYNGFGSSPTHIDWAGTGNIDFIGAYWTSAWDANQTLSFEGYRDGSLVYTSGDFTINDQNATLITLGWTNIDSLVIHNTGLHWAMDDFVFNSVAVVPEPSVLGLMFGGLGLVGLMAYRARQA